MTYYETLYLWGFLIIPILSILFSCMVDDPEMVAMVVPCWGLWILIGGFSTLFMINSSEYKVTATIETIPVSTTLTHFGLDVVTDENHLVRYTEYKDIQAWKDGAKLYKIYSYRKNKFGLDHTMVEVVFRKVEQ